jgi:hypothetical protein
MRTIAPDLDVFELEHLGSAVLVDDDRPGHGKRH